MSNVIGRSDAFHARFLEPLPEGADPNELISISPAVTGVPELWNTKQLNWDPPGLIDPGTYAVTITQGERVQVFEIEVPRSEANIALEPTRTLSTTEVSISGQVLLSDPMPRAAIESALTARLDDRPVDYVLSGEEAESRSWSFETTAMRGDADQRIVFELDDAALKLKDPAKASTWVREASVFMVDSIRTLGPGSTCVTAVFSERLDEQQDLVGLFTFDGEPASSVRAQGSTLRACKGGLSGVVTLRVEGLVSEQGDHLREPYEVTRSFARAVPKVSFDGDGQIVTPGSEAQVRVKAAGVASFDLKVVAVPHHNMEQFYQVNPIDGGEQLWRVGSVVHKESVEVPPTGDEGISTFSLDLSDVFEEHPAGLYRLMADFGPEHLIDECEKPPIIVQRDTGEDASYWDDWYVDASTTNPCVQDFYADERDAQRVGRANVVVTDLGVVARVDSEGDVHVSVSSLKTGDPIRSADVEALNFQQELLAHGATLLMGDLVLHAPGTRFLRVTHGADQFLLDLKPSRARSSANFDVSGVEAGSGIRGFLYAERGVRRPGDPITLFGMLRSEGESLPEDHAAEFTLRDPLGALVTRDIVHPVGDGMYRMDAITALDAPTGVYHAELVVGTSTFRKQVVVEAIRPNRLDIAFGEGLDRVDGTSLTLDETFHAEWLHGAPAKGLDAEIGLVVRPMVPTFPTFPEHAFDVLNGDDAQTFEDFWSQRLDGNGDARVTSNIELDGHGARTLAFGMRVFEPSGAYSSEQAKATAYLDSAYVGIKPPPGDKARGMLLTDEDHPVSLVLVDRQGKPVPGEVEAEVKLYKLGYRWWWEQDEQEAATYADISSASVSSSATVRFVDGKASWNLRVNSPTWGRFLITVHQKDGAVAAKEVFLDWPGWAGKGQDAGAGGASLVRVRLSEDEATIGDLVRAEFDLPEHARALVSVETGRGVAHSEWVEGDPSGRAMVTLPVNKTMVPNAYVQVTTIQPAAHMEGPAVRAYGIASLKVNDPSVVLSPRVDGPTELEPGVPAVVRVTEATGQAMTYSLAIVDEGLLGLTRFQTPDPVAGLFSREAIGVKTWDAYGELRARNDWFSDKVLAIGGGGEEDDAGGANKVQRFRPVAQVLGPFTVDAGGIGSHEVVVNDYLGKVRVMVVATSGDAFGHVEAAMPVRAPVMATLSLPRGAHTNERFDVPVGLFVDQEADVRLEATLEGPGAWVGSTSRTVHVDSASTEYLSVRTTGEQGALKFTVVAKANGEESTATATLPVTFGNPAVSRSVGKLLAKGDSYAVSPWDEVEPVSYGGVLELSTAPPMDLERHRDYLIRYPYGCSEQVTSSAMAQLALLRLEGINAQDRDRLVNHLEAARDTVLQRQTPSGGVAYWPGGSADDFATHYVGNFLVSLAEVGIPVDQARMRQILEWQRLRSSSRSEHQIAGLLLLARAGWTDMASMNVARLAWDELSRSDRARLAWAYAAAGRKDVARELLGRVSEPGRDETDSFIRRQVRDGELLAAAVAADADVADEIAVELSEHLTSDERLNTVDAALSLSAMADYIGSRSDIAQVSVDGAPVAVSGLVSMPLPVGELKVESIDKNVFVRVTQRGVLKGQGGPALTQGYRVNTELRQNGDRVDSSIVEQGSDLKLVVEVFPDTARRADDFALNVGIPSGWEISGPVETSRGWDHIQVNDSSVQLFGEVYSPVTVTVPVHAAFVGQYLMPAARAERMYQPSVFGVSASELTRVVPAVEPL